MKKLIVVILLVIAPHQAHAGVIRFTAHQLRRRVFPVVGHVAAAVAETAVTIVLKGAY